jgi:hypothetical protein
MADTSSRTFTLALARLRTRKQRWHERCVRLAKEREMSRRRRARFRELLAERFKMDGDWNWASSWKFPKKN